MRNWRTLVIGLVALTLALVALAVFLERIEGSPGLWTFFDRHRVSLCDERVQSVVVSSDKQYAIVLTNVNCLASFDEQVVYLREGSSESKSTPFGDTIVEVAGRDNISLEVPDSDTVRLTIPSEAVPRVFREKWRNITVERTPGWDPITVWY